MTFRATLHTTFTALLILGAPFALGAQKLPPVSETPAWRNAVVLELKGRYSEAFHQYLQVLLSKDFGSDPSPGAADLRAQMLGKLAYIAFELGWLEESWDLAGQWIASSPPAKTSAEALRARLLQPAKMVPPLPWVVVGKFPLLARPVREEVAVSAYSRLQLGAFRDWTRARTQLDILLEKGWVPFVEDRQVGKERLTAVFVISRHAADDLKRLRSQGFEPTALPVDPRR